MLHRALAPVDESFFDSAPWILDFPTTLHAPVAAVWAALVDNESWATWFSGCRSCRATSTPVGGVGSTRTITLTGMQVDERFILWEPERVWGFTAVGMGPAIFRRLAERVTLTDLGDGTTKLEYRMAIEPRAWLRPFRRLLASQSNKTFATTYANLERHLRSGS